MRPVEPSVMILMLTLVMQEQINEQSYNFKSDIWSLGVHICVM